LWDIWRKKEKEKAIKRKEDFLPKVVPLFLYKRSHRTSSTEQQWTSTRKGGHGIYAREVFSRVISPRWRQLSSSRDHNSAENLPSIYPMAPFSGGSPLYAREVFSRVVISGGGKLSPPGTDKNRGTTFGKKFIELLYCRFHCGIFGGRRKKKKR
jgi:hypothetical protein